MNEPQGNTVSEVGASTEELIARLEKAVGSNIELDYSIAEAAGLKIPSNRAIDPPFFTSSIDAALTLVPSPRWFWRVDSHDPSAWVYLNIQDAFKGNGRTPAIALCCAALKARKATGTTDTHRDKVNEQRAEGK